MTASNIFHYRKTAQQSVFPGAHTGQVVGNGLLFKHHRPLVAAADLRHLDLRASALNPFEHFQVKTFQQQSRLDVYLLADLSASMAYQGNYHKKQVIIDCLRSAAQSAYATGDRFGFVGCGQTIDPKLIISPASRQLGRVNEIAEHILTSTLRGQSDSLLAAANYLPSRSALVFLLSDFYMPIEMIQQQLLRLQQHTVVPLVLWDQKESHDLPTWGLVKFTDLEHGKTRTLLMRPSLRKKIDISFSQQKRRLIQCFRSFGCEPIVLDQGYRAELISQYFFQFAS